MKKLILTILIMVNMNVLAQPKTNEQYKADHHGLSLVTGIDIRNAVDGSNPTKGHAEVDSFIRLSMRGGHFGASLQYERFKRINFESFGFNLDYIDEIYIFNKELELHSGIEGGMIFRQLGKNDLFVGVNFEPRIKVFRYFYIGLLSNMKLRNDIKESSKDKLIFRPSEYLTITYKF